jgi:S1-C subfamily serine protease
MSDNFEPGTNPNIPPTDPTDLADSPTSTYRPPTGSHNGYGASAYAQTAASRPDWAPSGGWPDQTPQRWLEPMPSDEVKRRAQTTSRRRRQLVFVGGVVTVALLAATLSSVITVLILVSNGMLLASRNATPPPTAAAAVVNSPAPSSTPAPSVNDDQTVTRAAGAVGPAVVTITTTTTSTDPLQGQQSGIGSGWIYDAAGWILTNHHVVGSENSVQVELPDGRKFSGKVYGIDTLTDLAIVKIDASGLPAATIGDSSSIKPGQLAVAIGSPLGTFTNSVTSGVISALGRDVPVTDPTTGQQHVLHNLIQTDAAINPGNSGGPLIDGAGTVIGINTAVAGDAQGIGFAIPVNIAKPIMEQAVAGQALERPWMGLYYVPVNRSEADKDKLPIDYGAYVSAPDANTPAILSGSPADKAGLKEGDIITDVNGTRIDGTSPVDEVLSQYKPGDTVTLTVLRDGQTIQLPLTLGVRPAGS